MCIEIDTRACIYVRKICYICILNKCIYKFNYMNINIYCTCVCVCVCVCVYLCIHNKYTHHTHIYIMQTKTFILDVINRK